MLVGLTGNSGTGATTVARIWRELGGNVCHLDNTGHRLLEKPRMLRRIHGGTGIPGLLEADGARARKILSEQAFSRPSIIESIEKAMHPVMKRWVRARAEECRNRRGIWILEGALVLELGLGPLFHRLVFVSDTRERAFSRILLRDGVSRATAEGRWRNQMSPGEKAEKADMVIENSGSLNLLYDNAVNTYNKLVNLEVSRGEQNS